MPIFEQGSVVQVPFPYTDGNARQHRPALVISAKPVGTDGHLLWVAMITSAEHRSWPCDVPFGPSFRQAGLPSASVVRPWKIATIDTARATLIGRVEPSLLATVMAEIAAIIEHPRLSQP